MYIKCWGSRGSIPVSGGEYVRYGGDTTCLEIRTEDGQVVVVDAGTGIRRLGRRLLEEKQSLCHVIFTHAHWDHLLGFPFFEPIYRDDWTIHVYKCPESDNYVGKMLGTVMAPPNFPVRFEDLPSKVIFEDGCPDDFTIGTLSIRSIPLSHPNGGRGYRFEEGGKSFVFLTDNELEFIHPGGRSWEEYVEFSKGADLLVHDGEYTPEEYRNRKGWGHSRYNDAVKLAMDAEVGCLGLFHTNAERSDDAMDAIVERSRRLIGDGGSSVKCVGVAAGDVFEL